MAAPMNIFRGFMPVIKTLGHHLNSPHSLTFSRWMCIRRSVNDILQNNTNSIDTKHTKVKGWVRAVRSHKSTVFLAVNDGSGLTPLQVICTPEQADGVSYGSCISASGTLVSSPYSGQSVELIADNVHVIGPCDNDVYPFIARKKHPPDYTRAFPHLRPRTNLFSAILRVRSSTSFALHQHLQENGYVWIHTPILTTNDCEGAGETFTIQRSKDNSDANERLIATEHRKSYFGKPTYLTVSGQLHLEVATGGFTKVYTFGPTFRAESFSGRHHLSEFYMLEAELAFTESLEDILQVMEGLLKQSTSTILEKCSEDIHYIWKQTSPEQQKIVQKVLEQPFHRIPYCDAVDILQNNNENFQFKLSWGGDLKKEHERYLVKHMGGIPVFVIDFPIELKPFYVRANADGKTASSVDLLVPEVGELCGGSLREERLDVLEQRLSQENMDDSYEWYLDLRRFGSAPHAGFGLGFERYIQLLLGISNIKDTLPFPRTPRNCKL